MNAAIVQNLPTETPPVTGTPVDEFSECHRGLLCGLRAFESLPELMVAAARARAVATATLALFDGAVLTHHADEEKELFPAVLASARPGEERLRIEAVIARLIAEHRSVEALWHMLKPGVKRAAAGSAAELNSEAVTALVVAYNRHAAFEETEFLPAAKDILSRNNNHMAALGYSLHMRHTPAPVGYI